MISITYLKGASTISISAVTSPPLSGDLGGAACCWMLFSCSFSSCRKCSTCFDGGWLVFDELLCVDSLKGSDQVCCERVGLVRWLFCEPCNLGEYDIVLLFICSLVPLTVKPTLWVPVPAMTVCFPGPFKVWTRMSGRRLNRRSVIVRTGTYLSYVSKSCNYAGHYKYVVFPSQIKDDFFVFIQIGALYGSVPKG